MRWGIALIFAASVATGCGRVSHDAPGAEHLSEAGVTDATPDADLEDAPNDAPDRTSDAAGDAPACECSSGGEVPLDCFCSVGPSWPDWGIPKDACTHSYDADLAAVTGESALCSFATELLYDCGDVLGIGVQDSLAGSVNFYDVVSHAFAGAVIHSDVAMAPCNQPYIATGNYRFSALSTCRACVLCAPGPMGETPRCEAGDGGVPQLPR